MSKVMIRLRRLASFVCSGLIVAPVLSEEVQRNAAGKAVVMFDKLEPNVLHVVFALKEELGLKEETLFAVQLAKEEEGERRYIADTILKESTPALVFPRLIDDEGHREVQVSLKIDNDEKVGKEVELFGPQGKTLPENWILEEPGVYWVRLSIYNNKEKAEAVFLSEVRIVRGVDPNSGEPGPVYFILQDIERPE